MFWNRVIVAMTFGKAAIAGAGLAIATLGLVDVALAVTVSEWWDSFAFVKALDASATFGALGGILAKLIFRV